MGPPEMAGKHKNSATQVCRRLSRPDLGASDGGWPGNFTDSCILTSSSSLAGACIVVEAGIGSHG